MSRSMYPDDAEKKNRGFLGFDSSALSQRDLQVSLIYADTASCVAVGEISSNQHMPSGPSAVTLRAGLEFLEPEDLGCCCLRLPH